jgi:hypothetical protein
MCYPSSLSVDIVNDCIKIVAEIKFLGTVLTNENCIHTEIKSKQTQEVHVTI